MSKSNNKMKAYKHCCKDMAFFLGEQKVAIFYNPIFREYFIRMRSYPDGKQAIYNCPWCGYKFPVSLVEKYNEILVEEYNLSYEFGCGNYFDVENFIEYKVSSRKIPKEFKSDEWWKKRGL